MIDTVIFDMDGLLIDSEPLWREAMAAVFAKMNIYLEKEDYIKTMGMRTVEVVEYWHHRLNWKEKPPEEVVHEIIEEVMFLIRTKGKMMDGVPEILDFFRQKKFKTGLASSSPMILITEALAHFGLSGYFDACHSGEHEDYGKPHPSVYLSCARALKSDSGCCLVFEDSIAGLIAAKAAKMKAVAVPGNENPENPRYALADLKLASLRDFSEADLRYINSL